MFPPHAFFCPASFSGNDPTPPAPPQGSIRADDASQDDNNFNGYSDGLFNPLDNPAFGAWGTFNLATLLPDPDQNYSLSAFFWTSGGGGQLLLGITGSDTVPDANLFDYVQFTDKDDVLHTIDFTGLSITNYPDTNTSLWTLIPFAAETSFNTGDMYAVTLIPEGVINMAAGASGDGHAFGFENIAGLGIGTSSIPAVAGFDVHGMFWDDGFYSGSPSFTVEIGNSNDVSAPDADVFTSVSFTDSLSNLITLNSADASTTDTNVDPTYRRWIFNGFSGQRFTANEGYNITFT